MKTGLVTSEIFLEHDTGHSHPECKERLSSVLEKIQSKNYFNKLQKIEPRKASFEEISLNHDLSYITQFEKKVSLGSGYFDQDTPYSKNSFLAAIKAVGAGLDLADKILASELKNGLALVRPPGHHAVKEHAMGFCMFNNIAITAKYLKSKGMKKILIYDFDVHHGNGTESSFYEDEEVYFISTHQFPFYPGTGSPTDIGFGKGKNFTKNIPLARGTSDSKLIEILKEEIIPIIDDFQPEIILLSSGFDAHKLDPLGGLEISTNGFEKITEILKNKAEEICKGKLISFLEGGYNLSALSESVESHLSVLNG
jgi:acetoin utilization deacetylase AcuC-like enzyme